MKFVLALFLASAANAQFETTLTSGEQTTPTGASQVSACVLSCLNTAASAGGCTSFADIPCVCTSTAFQTAAKSCLAQCTPADQASALQLEQSQCINIVTSPGSIPATATATVPVPATTIKISPPVTGSVTTQSKPSTTPPPNGNSITSAAGPSSSSGAAMRKVQFAYGGAVGIFVICIGAVVGAFLVL